MDDIWCNFIAIGIIHIDPGAGGSGEARSLDLTPQAIFDQGTRSPGPGRVRERCSGPLPGAGQRKNPLTGVLGL